LMLVWTSDLFMVQFAENSFIIAFVEMFFPVL
jgi:hypothetical protein